MTETLAAWSQVAVYSAALIYAIAFIAFVLDLAKRSATATPKAAVAERVPAMVLNPATSVVEAGRDRTAGAGAVAGPDSTGAHGPSAEGASTTATGTGAPSGRSTALRVGFALAVLGWVVHVGAAVTRGIAAERVPWANLFEFTLTGTAIMMGVYLIAQLWRDLRFLGAYVSGIVVVLLTLATLNFYVAVVPLPPPLQSAWLVIHVLFAVLATGFFALGAGLSIAQLLQGARERGGLRRAGFLRTLPGAETLEQLAYRLNVVGFALWTFTLVCGAIWAERAWGRYWGWDTKEVWTFVIWVVFAGYIHARATRGWRGARSAWLAIIGFAAVIFNFTIVNLFFAGLHSYSGL